MKSTPRTTIRTMDIVLDKVFDMEGGYVLNFSNRTFANFFWEELHVNIDDPRWYGGRQQQGETPALLLALRRSKNRSRVECPLGVPRNQPRHT